MRFLPAFCFSALTLSCDVAAIAFRRNILPHCANRLPRDDFAADRGGSHFEQLSRDQVLKPWTDLASPVLGLGPVDDHGEADGFAVHQDRDLTRSPSS